VIYELNHAGILAEDLERSLSFYCLGLGGTIVFRKKRLDRSAEIVYVRLGDGLVELIGGLRATADFGSYGPHHLGFMTDDIDADFRRLVEWGAEPWLPPSPAGTGVGFTAFVLDRSGTRVELIERDPDFRAQPTGAVYCSVEHYSVYTDDPASSSEFYGGLLGMRAVSDASGGYFSLGNDRLRVESTTKPKLSGVIGCTVVTVPDLDDVGARLENLGFTGEQDAASVDAKLDKSLLFRDPDGSAVVIREHAITWRK
jgi:catechol 2,3-dioxygenase-like lactoylglutathione lyase family enzyme